MKRALYLVLISCFCLTKVQAQDLHFSMYDETPSMLNPAITGSTHVFRAAMLYKRQWESVTVPYKTVGASFDMKFKASSWEKQDPFKTKTYKKSFSRMAGGLSFFNDVAGDGNMGMNQVNVSLASFLKTGRLSTFSAGIQGSVVQKSVNYSSFIFSNQYNGSSYDPTVPSNELTGTQSFIYADFAAGLYWRHVKQESKVDANDVLHADVGAAVFHVAAPRQKFVLDTDERLYRRFAVHSKFLIGIPYSNFGIAPSILAQFQGPDKEFVFGFMTKYFMRNDSRYTGFVKKSSIGLGVYYRYMDAIVPTLILELGQYAIGFAYDLNFSGLTPASRKQGGVELMIRFNSADPFLFQKR